jgi:hypothetical protein
LPTLVVAEAGITAAGVDITAAENPADIMEVESPVAIMAVLQPVVTTAAALIRADTMPAAPR